MPNRRWTDTQIIEAVKDSTTISEVLRAIGLSTSPGNFQTFHNHVKRLSLDTTHFTGQAHLRGKSHMHKKARPLIDLLVKGGSPISSVHLKRRLLQAGLLTERCGTCGQGPVWNGRPLTLQLDHINGDSYDNRLENLRILCPNCHTQTSTFTGGNRSRYSPVKKVSLCVDCQEETSGPRWERCPTCAPRASAKPKIEWPPIEDLRLEIEAGSYVAVARRLGVSDNAVRKHLRLRG